MPRANRTACKYAWMELVHRVQRHSPAGLALALSLLLPCLAGGQAQTSSGPPPDEGSAPGGYIVHQAIELGGQIVDQSGSEGMYATLVNVHSGPRLLEQTLSMQSQHHDSALFDNLFVSSFGWGGDPENAFRARVDKNRWYNFRASFRRAQNNFDYNLLANPLNPSTSTPSIPVLNAPHLFETRRRFSDVDLTLLPQSSVSFRLGYSRNNMTGPSYSSFHEGTDVLLLQPWNTTLNSYRLGVDWKPVRRTVLSFDQLLDYYKGDTQWQLGSFAPALLPGGAGTVELGLPINTQANQPCAVVPPATSLIDASGTLTNMNCNAYFSYLRTQRIRTSAPTERLSLRSNYFNRLELTASYAYSSADMSTPFSESFNGLVTRTKTRQYTITGPADANRVSNVFDFSATLHLTSKLRLIEHLYYWAYRIPESFNSTETDQNCSGTCSLLIAPDTTVTTNTPDQQSFNQKWTRNQIDLAYDFSKKFGARVGYRYGDKKFDHFLDFTTGDFDHIAVIENTVLFAVWAKPSHALRLNFDLEHIHNNDSLVRIAPRNESRYRAQANYTPRSWAVIGASLNVFENSNGDSLVDYRGHNRNYGFNASMTPSDRYALDVAYNYSDYQQNGLICFNDTPPATVSLPVVNNAGSCAANDPGNPLLTNGYYTSRTHFGMFNVRFKPIKRVETRLGYSITNVDGTTPQFNILQPLGSLASRYLQPLALVSVDLGHHLAWNAGWNYYQYNESSFVGPTLPRYFHANKVTLSLRWEF